MPKSLAGSSSQEQCAVSVLIIDELDRVEGGEAISTHQALILTSDLFDSECKSSDKSASYESLGLDKSSD